MVALVASTLAPEVKVVEVAVIAHPAAEPVASLTSSGWVWVAVWSEPLSVRLGNVILPLMNDSVPAVTINRFCSSGVQAIAMAADRIRTGDDDVVIAAGTESMSMVPMMGNKIALNDAVFTHNEHIAIAYGSPPATQRQAIPSRAESNEATRMPCSPQCR